MLPTKQQPVNSATPVEESPVEEQQETPEQEQGEPEETIDEDVSAAVLQLLQHCEQEDWEIRVLLMKEWRQIQEYWRGIQDRFWDDVAKDWRSFASIMSADSENLDETSYNKIVNILRAHGESIIAALSVDTPNVIFTPDDADNPVDVSTAYGLSDVVSLIEKHNDAPLKQIFALLILCTQGTIFGYNYYREDPKYGTVKRAEYENQDVDYSHLYCTYCGESMGVVRGQYNPTQVQCPHCGQTVIPQANQFRDTIRAIKGYSDEPKGRECFELFGPMHVKIPIYAREQKDIGYLRLAFEQHQAMLKSEFKDFAEKISNASVSGEDSYERNLRLGTDYLGIIPRTTATVQCLWVRPWMYQEIVDEEVRAKLLDKYPDGLYSIILNKEVAILENENLDDHWTISFDPLSDYIHGDPVLKPLVHLQDIQNDLTNLTLSAIEYGIPENFADNTVLDFKKYSEQQAQPGMITPAKSPAGKALSDGFFQFKPASLSQEHEKFQERIDQMAQFVVHDFPSVFGGGSDKSGTTATEYSKSQAAALQALKLSWIKFSYFWIKLLSKCAFEFVSYLNEDQAFATKQNGRWQNVWLVKEKLAGKIAGVEPEGAEQLPLNWAQKRQVIQELLTLKSPEINSVIFSPNNADFIKRSFGADEITIPGEQDRVKQLSEIYELVDAQPMDQQTPSVQIDPDIDDHAVHMQVMKSWLVSDKGQYLKKFNAAGYQNCILHYRQHQQAQAGATAGFSGLTKPGQTPQSATGTITT